MSYREFSAAPGAGIVRAGQFLGVEPSAKVRRYGGPKDTLDTMALHALGENGEKNMLVRWFTEHVVKDVHPKDYLGEILAIRNCFVQESPWRSGTPLFRYTNDPRHVELVKTPRRMVDEIRQNGTTVVDCDDIATMAATMCLLIGREVELVALGFEPRVLSHVGVRAKEPKSGRWIWLDGVAGPREREAAQRAKELMVLSLD